LAHDRLEIVGRAEAALAALHIDDGAEGALIGAAAAEIEARPPALAQAQFGRGQRRERLAFETRQIIEMIVEGLERAVEGVADDLIEAAVLGFAGEERDAHLLRGDDLLWQLLQHRDAARDVEATEADGEAGGEEVLRQVDGTRELVRLDSDQADEHLAAPLFQISDDAARADALMCLVIGFEMDVDAFAQHVAARAIAPKAIEGGERVGGDDRAVPGDGIAVVVIMRRLYHHYGKGRNRIGHFGFPLTGSDP